ncbi:hypothetical protein ACJRO7_032601 [Eucalyptus globulus]|uniref:Gnk2-homologous domain-containing protein n=1 Tax=Eucalyptus globulus TaxID=34317 RepID=A0ABD3JNT9_EUCGL
MQQMVKLLVIGLFSTCNFVKCTPDTTEVYHICNGEKCWSFDEFVVDRARVLDYLSDGTATNNYNYYAESSSCYGHGVCNGALTQSDCSDCILAAENALIDTCDYSIGAQIQLKDCRVRYEAYPFSE